MSTSKTILKPVVLVNAQSISANFTSNPFSLERYSRAVLELIIPGTVTGTLILQASTDFVPSNMVISPSVSPATWYDMPLGLNALSGSGDSYFIDLGYTGVPWVRVKLSYSAGAGSLTVVITAKES